jgi:3-deoxy-D-manno-octulosonic-acid transferase
VHHTYIPYDYSGAVKRFLTHINPKILIIMETELWPNILHYSAKNKVFIMIANARLSLHSVTSYRRIKWFMRSMFKDINVIAAQSQLDKERFISIGAEPNQIEVVGNIKFEINLPDNLNHDAQKLRDKWGKNRHVFIAASTHDNEEQQILAAFKTIKSTIPNTLLILVPRHPERFTIVTNLCKNTKFKTISHKQQTPCTPNTDIIIGDTMGELLLLYAASDVAFVGGSLVPIGGHNLLEPAAVGIPVITGPHVNNTLAVADLLTKAGALITVNNATELAQEVINLLNNNELRQKYAQAGLKVVEENKGVIERLTQHLI